MEMLLEVEGRYHKARRKQDGEKCDLSGCSLAEYCPYYLEGGGQRDYLCKPIRALVRKTTGEDVVLYTFEEVKMV